MEGPVVDAITYYNQAVDAASNGSDEMAMELVDKALAIKPDFYLAQVTKAGLLSKNGNNTGALQVLEEANKSHSDNAYVLAAKASILINMEKYPEAREAADEAVSRDPSLVEAWILKGTAHGGLEEFEDEINASKQALVLDPENTEAKSNFNFAQEKIKSAPNKNDPKDAERTPLPFFVALVAVLFSCLYLKYQN